MSIRIMLNSVAVLCLFFSGMSVGQEDKSLVARWDFDESKGIVAHDSSGNNIHGRIAGGARFVQRGDGFALQLDGRDDYVDCGANPKLRALETAGTLEVWYQYETPGGGLLNWSSGTRWQDERLILAVHTYAGGQLLVSIADGAGHVECRSQLPEKGVWNYAALTYNGRTAVLYQNGVRDKVFSQGLKPRIGGIPLWIGKCQGLNRDFLKGLIDEVRVYDRALSPQEIVANYKERAASFGKDTAAFRTPQLRAEVFPGLGRIRLEARYMLMQPLPAGALLAAGLHAVGRREPFIRADAQLPRGSPACDVFFDAHGLAPGEYQIRASVKDAAGATFGESASTTVAWPGQPEKFRKVKVLNNLVFELLNVESPGGKEFTIHNPREGWIFLSMPAQLLRTASPTVTIDSKAMASLKRVGDNYEAMRYMSEGPHTIRVGKGIDAKRLVVRSIGELFYNSATATPHVRESVRHDWAFLRKHILDHVNTLVTRGGHQKYEKEIRQWVAQGGRWTTECGLPWVKTADEAYSFWSKQPGMQHPLASGIWADEFSHGGKFAEMYPLWCEAIRRMKANPEFTGRMFYAYGGMFYHPGFDLMINTLMECGYRQGPQWYLREQFGEENLAGIMDRNFLRTNRDRFENACPRSAGNRVMVLSILSQPEESCDFYPHANYNVFLDRQFHLLATDPAFFGLRGIMGYSTWHAGEEVLRLYARLLRYYAIEGRTDRLLRDPYILTHLRNPDFLDGVEGWQLSPASPGSITAKTVRGFGWLQGRYTRQGIGDSTLWTKRRGRRPNVFSQDARNLEPGRRYSLRFFTGNYRDLVDGESRKYGHAISVKIDNVELIHGKAFDAIIKNCYAHKFGAFDRTHRYWSNYHQRIFRAKGRIARLTFSDWASDTQPGGGDGAELIWNFIQVQPYFAE